MSDFLDSFNAPSAERALLWIVLLPLLGAIINGVFGSLLFKGRVNRGLVGGVAVGTVFGSFLLALFCFGRLWGLAGEDHEAGNHAIVNQVYQWFSITIPGGGGIYEVPVNVRFVMDHLSGVMTLMVTGIASLIHLYSTGYMGEDPGYPRFMTYLNLFTASMLVLVLASNAPLMFVGWEGVGLCSYLLIGYWWENPAYAAAGRKAFVVNRIGDFGVLLGTFLLVATTRSFEFVEINSAAAETASTAVQLGGLEIGVTVGTLACIFLFLGCAGKSAQLPLYVWLPDAMAGPTPVSALIHAATMVTAGIYLCCRLSNVFIHSEVALSVIAIVGALTAFLGASIGVVQNQMKKILAYSTVSQLGFMFAAVGCGAFAGGFFHVFTHAFFKACLFLGAGSVMHAVHAHGDADIRYLGGMRKYMPRTALTFGISCLAIAGIPPFAGFFSKDEILLGALDSTTHMAPWVGWTVFVLLAATAAMTAFYMFRLYFKTFEGEFKGGHPPAEEGHETHDDEHHHAEPHESEDSMTIPLIVLAVGAVVAGFLGLPHWMGLPNWWEHWMTGEGDAIGAVARWRAEHGAEGEHTGMGFGPVAMLVGLLVGAGGTGLAYLWCFKDERDSLVREALVVRVGLGFAGAAILVAMGMIARTVAGYAIIGTGTVVMTVIAELLLLSMLVGVGYALSRPAERVHAMAFDKWSVDELYDAVLVGPFKGAAVVVANIDRVFVDGLLTKVPPFLARSTGWIITRAQTGAIYAYTTGLVLGVGALVWWFTFPHPTLVGEATGRTARWTTDAGATFEYRWDFDSDGEYDTDWSTDPEVDHAYWEPGAEEALALVAIVEGGQLAGLDAAEIPLTNDATPLPLDEVGFAWAREEGGHPPANPSPATVRIDGDHVLLVANDATVSAGGRTASAEEQEFELVPGDAARLGLASVRIAVRARATVEVRNVFGNLGHASAEVTLRVPRTQVDSVASLGSAPDGVASVGGAR